MLVGFGQMRFGLGAGIGGLVARGFGAGDGVEQGVALFGDLVPARLRRLASSARISSWRRLSSAICAAAASRRALQRAWFVGDGGEALLRALRLRGSEPSSAARASPLAARASAAVAARVGDACGERHAVAQFGQRRIGLRCGFCAPLRRDWVEAADFRFQRRQLRRRVRRRRGRRGWLSSWAAISACSAARVRSSACARGFARRARRRPWPAE